MSPRRKGPRTFTANSPGRENTNITQDNAKSHQYVKKLEFNGDIKLGKEGLNPPELDNACGLEGTASMQSEFTLGNMHRKRCREKGGRVW